jgi:hypothetical protein
VRFLRTLLFILRHRARRFWREYRAMLEAESE